MQETQETQVRFLGQEDLLEKETAIYSSILAWKIPWTEEPGRLHTVHVSHRVELNWRSCLGHYVLQSHNSPLDGKMIHSSPQPRPTQEERTSTDCPATQAQNPCPILQPEKRSSSFHTEGKEHIFSGTSRIWKLGSGQICHQLTHPDSLPPRRPPPQQKSSCSKGPVPTRRPASVMQLPREAPAVSLPRESPRWVASRSWTPAVRQVGSSHPLFPGQEG